MQGGGGGSETAGIQQTQDSALVCEGGEGRLVPTDAADEAGWVVGPPQGRHHLPADVLLAAVTLGAVEPLVVVRADVLAGLVEEP